MRCMRGKAGHRSRPRSCCAPCCCKRLLAGEIAAGFLAAVLNLPDVHLLSREHFSVDGTLIQAWASMKSFRRKDGTDQPPGPGRNGTRDFHNDKRSNRTHVIT